MINYKANKFKKKFKINSWKNANYLKMVIHKLGYNVCSYSEGLLKLSVLGLEKEIKTAPALSLTDIAGNVTVYYNDTLPEPEQRLALAHEIAHLVLGHFDSNKSKQQQEDEADEFAEYLLAPSNKSKTYLIILYAWLSIFLVITMCSTSTIENAPTFDYITYSKTTVSSEPVPENNITSNETSSDTPSSESSSKHTVSEYVIRDDTVCYLAKYSEVYHLDRNCYHLKNSKNVYIATVGTCDLKRACSHCGKN